MNIFYLDKDPVLAAQYHCDKHVLKMILETCTLLNIAKTELVNPGMSFYYKGVRYKNHPCAKWARASLLNYEWLHELFFSLLDEYSYRWEKMHKYECHCSYFCLIDCESKCFPNGVLTPPPLCMPGIYHHEDHVQAYRDYYCGEKTHLLKYTRRDVPEWISALGLGEHK